MRTFSHLSDSQWLSVLKRSLDERIDGLPGFPPEDKQRHWVGADGAMALDEAFIFYAMIKAAYPDGLTPKTQILDFGIGWGRIARFFVKDVGSIYGVDVSEEALAICRDTGVPAQLQRIEPTGVLPYPDRSLDIVYAYSVFTHLPEAVQNIWLAEIARVLRPGGLFVATVRSAAYLERTGQPPQAQAELSKNGFVFLPTHEGIADIYGDTVIAPEYIRTNWRKHFHIEDVRDDLANYLQHTIIASTPSPARPPSRTDLQA